DPVLSATTLVFFGDAKEDPLKGLLKQLDEFIFKNKDRPDLYLQKGKVLTKLTQYDLAIGSLLQGISLKLRVPSSNIDLADFFAALDEATKLRAATPRRSQ